MLHICINSDFFHIMDLFKEIDDLSDLFFLEKNPKLESVVKEHEDLQSKYTNLHENYAKEIENSKKVEKCLVKCLKFYSKLCKKYEVQQKIISNLEEGIKEKITILEEAQKNEERMKGLIEVYRTERTLYAGQSISQLRKDKELLLDICCKLISESVKSPNTGNLTHLLLRKFRKDLDDKKLSMLKGKCIKPKDEFDFGRFELSQPYFTDLKNEMEFKSEDKFNNELTKVEVKDLEENSKNDALDLSLNRTIAEESDSLDDKHLDRVSEKEVFFETEQNASAVVSSLPSLEEFPETCQQCQSDDGKQECDLVPLSKNITESPILFTSIEKESAALIVNETQEFPIWPLGKSGSIFDVGDSDSCLTTVSNYRAEMKQQETTAVESEGLSDIFFESEVKSNGTNIEINPEKDEESIFPYEKELFKIFREMSSIRVLSPIRECTDLSISSKTCTVTLNVNKNEEFEKPKPVLKRKSNADRNSSKSKKFRPEEKTNCNLLDSILSAMSIQNEEFKGKGLMTKEGEQDNIPESSCELGSPSERTFKRSGSSKENSFKICQSPTKKEAKCLRIIEKVVMGEIKSFVSAPISSKEEADINVKRCISVLSNKSEDVIAKCIVAIVLENVDETVEIFERPSPPLTRTQHRLIVLLSVFRTLDSSFQNISNKILSIISEKLLPDNFFWPDDSVEAAARFYTALCRARNDTKTLWRFCLQGMTDMRQRCPLLMLTALKTWPDALHDASTLKNNVLAVTIVNIFLHMPKKEGLRNFNQSRKLVALKHLLLNFYQFKIEDTIEGYAKKVLDSVFRDEPGSEKSIVLLTKCRDQNWTVKNILPILKSKLAEWAEEKIKDKVASRILSVIKQICPALQEDGVRAKVKEIGFSLSEILTSAKKDHDSEVNIVEVLLQLKQYPEIRKVIREWIPKNPIAHGLRNEIINASAENILRELKLNRRKETKRLTIKKKSKKSKKKKLKGKKAKKNLRKSREASVPNLGISLGR